VHRLTIDVQGDHAVLLTTHRNRRRLLEEPLRRTV
jgi:hypothetical protein